MEISEIGVNNPVNIYNTSFDGEPDPSVKASSDGDAAYTEISGRAQSLAGKEVDKTKLLDLLGPAVSENYSDLIVSISKHTSRIASFIDKVNSKIDLYA
jgi:hypothetical protein